jgi:hypothetical protein
LFLKLISNFDFYYNYKPFYVFDRFKLRDVYFSLWGNLLVHSYLRFQATDLHTFRLVGKALAHKWFLTYVWPWNGTVVCARLKKSKNHIISYHIISYHTKYNLVRNTSSPCAVIKNVNKIDWAPSFQYYQVIGLYWLKITCCWWFINRREFGKI